MAGPSSGSQRFWRAAVPALLALAVLLAFLPALQGGFLNWDDDRNFLANLDYRGLGAAQLRWMWTTFHMGHYVPLTWMSHGLDYLLWGMRPGGYHLDSLLLHAANAVLVYAIALRLFRRADGASPPSESAAGGEAPGLGTGRTAAALAALLYALHPLRVESVAWITERRDVLSGFFYFLAILLYLRSRESSRTARAWYWTSVAAFACAMLSKAMAMSLPLVLLVLDAYPLRRLGGPAGWRGPAARRVYLEKLPYAALAAALATLAPVALGRVEQLPVPGKAAVSAYGLVFYLWKTLLPVRLSPLYPMPDPVHPAELRFLVSLGAVAVLGGTAWMVRRRWPAFTAGALVWLVILLPVLGVVQNGPQIAADRYTYLAGSVPALLAACWFRAGAGVRAASRVGANRGERTGPADAKGARAAGRMMPNVVLGAIVVALGGLTWRQAGYWRDSDRLWARALAIGSGGAIARNNYGQTLAEAGRLAEAAAYYREATALAPRYASPHSNLGVALARQGRRAEAIEEFRRAIALQPEYAEAHMNLGVALTAEGATDRAVTELREALRINPRYAEAEVNWGNALLGAGRPEEAIGHYQAALRLNPTLLEAHNNWGAALGRLGRLDEAVDHFRSALALRPDDPESRRNLEQAERLRRAKPPD